MLTDPGRPALRRVAGITRSWRDLGVRLAGPGRSSTCPSTATGPGPSTRAGRDPRRYAWEDGEVCEYRLEGGEIVRRTALLVHLQKRTMRAPSADVLAADRYWITANGFTVQHRVSPRAVRAARLPVGRELVPFYVRRVQRAVRRRAARRAARADQPTVGARDPAAAP